MRKKKSDQKLNTSFAADDLIANKRPPWILFAALLLIYIATIVVIMLTSSSDAVITVAGHGVPVRSLTGAFSGLGNICIIFLVVLYKKPGFIVSVVLLAGQFPKLAVDLIRDHNYSGIAGIFANILTIVAITSLYVYNYKVGKYQLAIQEQATTDMGTKLPNRLSCKLKMKELVKRGEPFVVVIMNLNNFKSINNAMGQATGDAILAVVADRLKKAAAGDSSGRLNLLTYNGRDEFTFFIDGCRNDKDIIEVIEYYRSVLNEKISYDECDYYLTARFGYAEFLTDADDGDVLYAHALAAMTKAKEMSEKNHICRYTASLHSYEHEMEMERKIRSALDENRVFFLLQPQYDTSHNLRGFEVLARIRDADGSVIRPADFIPVAEKVDLIDHIDYTVFRDAATFLGKLSEISGTSVTLSFNVSARHLMKNDFLKEIEDVVRESGMPADRLELEITESIMIDSVDEAMKSINAIKNMGLKIAIDDFGTGYSSLSYLNNFPVDVLKIDKTFIDKMNTGDSHKQYVAAIVSISHVMKYKTIAEGVETEDQLETLKNIGCDYIQGFIWGKPVIPEIAAKIVEGSL